MTILEPNHGEIESVLFLPEYSSYVASRIIQIEEKIPPRTLPVSNQANVSLLSYVSRKKGSTVVISNFEPLDYRWQLVFGPFRRGYLFLSVSLSSSLSWFEWRCPQQLSSSREIHPSIGFCSRCATIAHARTRARNTRTGIDRASRLRSRFCHHRFRISCGESGFGNIAPGFSLFNGSEGGTGAFD